MAYPRKRLWLSALLALATVGVAPALPAHAATGSTYYLASDGADDAAGTSENAPWRTLGRIAATTFGPGDRILLRAGDSWTGQLWPKGSGEEQNPITIDRYGTGAKPRIDGGGTVADTVRLFNQAQWSIRNLEVTNAAPQTGVPGENLRDLRGIHVSGDNGTTLDGFVVDAVDVHDVTGEINWIGGSGDPTPGVTFGTGWDRSKRTGGIVFDTGVADITSPGPTPTILNDVLIQNSTIRNTSFAGITVKQYAGTGPGAASTGWGTRTSATDTRFSPHTNVVIRNNYITQGGTPFGCNGIYLTDVRDGLIERNVVHRAGTSGIESYFSDRVTIQFNEVYETEQKAGGADSNGIDPDKGTTAHVVQYNYVHHNGDGILLCQFVFGDVVVRGNVIASNSRYQIYLHSDRAARARIEHNTVYSDRSSHLVYGYGDNLTSTYALRNNVFYSARAGASLVTSPTITWEANLFGGATLPVPPGGGISGDPLLTDRTVSGPYGTASTGPQLTTAHAFRLAAASPAIDAGVPVADNGGRDYAGTTLYNGGPDMGAFEYRTPPLATTETVSGTVSSAGGPLAGVDVTVGPVATVTDADGRFTVADVPFSENVQVTASHDGYEPASQTVAVRDGNRTTVTVTLRSTSTAGTVTGRTLDQTGTALAGASVTLGTVSVLSGADGVFTLPDVPAGEGYRLTAQSPGLVPVTRDGLTVRPAAVTDVGALLLPAPTPTDVDSQDFDALPVGTLADGTNGLTVSASGGSVQIVEAPSATDRSVRLTRTANSGTTRLLRAFDPPLRGLVTIESRIMRDDGNAASANWYGVPYLTGANGVNAVSVAFSKSAIIAYAGGSTVTVGSYQQGRWYHVRQVVDTVNQRFDLWIDGAPVLTGASFRTTLDGVARVDYFANSSNYGSIHLDDVRVAQGVTPAGLG